MIADLELVRLAPLGQDVWLVAVSSQESLLQTGQLGSHSLNGLSKVLGPGHQALREESGDAQSPIRFNWPESLVNYQITV